MSPAPKHVREGSESLARTAATRPVGQRLLRAPRRFSFNTTGHEQSIFDSFAAAYDRRLSLGRILTSASCSFQVLAGGCELPLDGSQITNSIPPPPQLTI
jgi:hypothetical protein